MGQLKQLFPDAFSEGKIDFDVLKQLLGSDVDDSEERYGLNWHGKRQARQIALSPSRGTLRPCQEESVNWDSTQNLMIEGDNLEVLKLLQKSYSGKVKLIYIDPPYNTGKDFVYPDNFQDNIQNYLELTGQTNGKVKISTNTETSGRYHTDWLNMIYPRLKLARDLLSKDGVIFISVDDVEQDNLKKVCSEIFGEENFVSTITWEKRYSPQNAVQWFSEAHDFILVYAFSKNDWQPNLLMRSNEMNARYRNLDDDPRGDWKPTDATAQGGHGTAAQFYELVSPSGKKFQPSNGRCWLYTKERMHEMIADNRVWFGSSGNSTPSIKRFLTEVKQGVACQTIWKYEDVGHNQEGKKEIKNLFPEAVPFDTPKPTRLLRRILELSTDKDQEHIVLDFFAGSGTTGNAVQAMNAEDNGNRRYILVQLPEPLSPDNKEQKIASDFCDLLGKQRSIAEITKERLRRSGDKVRTENIDWHGDTGFRVFKLDTSNIRPWSADAASLDAQMQASLSPLLEDRSQDDVMTELLLKRGIDLSVRLEVRDFDGLRVTCAGNGMLFTCLESHIPASSIEALASGLTTWHRELGESADAVCYFIDEAFENNVAKSNLCATLVQQGLNQLHSL